LDWISYDLIQGKAWFSEANTLIDWKLYRMILKQDDRLITLDAEACRHGVSQKKKTIIKQGKVLKKRE